MDPMATDADLLRTLDFFVEIDKLKGVDRRNRITDGTRCENTAEHSWHLGMACLLLAPFATEQVDLLRAVSMALVHDIVEIDAGDTFAYDTAGEADKRAREEAAAERLFAILPADRGADLRELWEEYERGDTPEARFVMAVDRMAPMLINLTEGGTAWREHGIGAERVADRNQRYVEPALPGVWAEAARRLADATARGVVAP